jgi:hypothetical protein
MTAGFDCCAVSCLLSIVCQIACTSDCLVRKASLLVAYSILLTNTTYSRFNPILSSPYIAAYLHALQSQQVVRAAIYNESGKFYPSLGLWYSLCARLSSSKLYTVANLKRLLEYCTCQALIGFIFLSHLVPVATLLLFPIQGFVALRFSQVGVYICQLY